MSSTSEEQLLREFRRIDKNGDGSITVEELKNYYIPMQEMLGMSAKVAEQEIIGLVKRLDVDNSGEISFEGNIDRSSMLSSSFFILSFFRIQSVF